MRISNSYLVILMIKKQEIITIIIFSVHYIWLFWHPFSLR